MNKLVKSACLNAVAVKAKLDVMPKHEGAAEDHFKLFKAEFENIMVQELLAYCDITTVGSQEHYFTAYKDWRDMVSYNSTVVGAMIRIIKQRYPEKAASYKHVPIWETVDLDLIVNIVKALVNLKPSFDESLQNALKLQAHHVLMMHATDNAPMTEEYLSKLVRECGFDDILGDTKGNDSSDTNGSFKREHANPAMGEHDNYAESATACGIGGVGAAQVDAAIEYEDQAEEINLEINGLKLGIKGYKGKLSGSVSGLVGALKALGLKK